ncbi:response regulator transcription factor [Knoellia sp. Soil729]|uniref:response regulator transcription factor n=1 Tax=Knoellia sp. Soil729 TaxID=1736394 RepID=UPI0006F724AE|nr:response regulator transcription factor [Knoellia sp. Soil729]KRE43148.1 two-component system response regulator [Knoellia sp. Soil729]
MGSHVLLVEDDDRIAAPLVRTLEREGYDVQRLAQGLPALELLASGSVDLLLLDLGLADVDGLEVCRRAREAGYAGGVIILTARDGELDRVVGLDVGADDYLAKPFGLSELLARARAVLRRSAARTGKEPPTPPAPPPASTGLRVDVQSRRVWVGAAELPATSKEFDVLALLDAPRGAVVSRERLINEVWDENWFGSTKTLDATVGRLRQKLEDAAAPAQVTTVRGVGFRLEDAQDA